MFGWTKGIQNLPTNYLTEQFLINQQCDFSTNDMIITECEILNMLTINCVGGHLSDCIHCTHSIFVPF